MTQAYQPPSLRTTLIEALQEQPNYLMEQYNKQIKAENESKGIKKAGGVYIPPHKLRALQQQMLQADPSSESHQRLMWQLLRKSINGIVNKVNITNIKQVVIQLFNENILRGRGLLARAIIKAQMASPNFTHVYAALLAVVNTKIPQIGELIINRIVIQFKRSFERNVKLVCVATLRMIAHLVNQHVLGQYLALQIFMILLDSPTEDSVELACDFMVEVGQVLSEVTPAGTNAIFDRFKVILHEAQIDQKGQYSIQNLFAVRKTGFKQHPGVIPELDLVEPEDQITHQIDITDEITGEERLNIFRLDKEYEKTEEEWDRTKLQILGQQNLTRLRKADEYQEEWDQVPEEQGIQDLTEQDLINLRKTIYLAIQSTVNFQECAHKMLKMNIAKGHEHELVDMILECCMMERIYQSFFGLLAERFCTIDQKFKEYFIQAFLSNYNNIFKQQANKIRNLALLYAHLFYRQSIDWTVFSAIRLTPDNTTAAARMFLKILFKNMAENIGVEKLWEQLNKEETKHNYEGLFPIDNLTDLRFAINYYTTIGLGRLTQQMREVLAIQQQLISERKRAEEEEKIKMLLQEEEELLKLADQQQNKKKPLRNFEQPPRQQRRPDKKEQKRARMDQQQEYIPKRRHEEQRRQKRRSHSRSFSSEKKKYQTKRRYSRQKSPSPYRRRKERSTPPKQYQERRRERRSSTPKRKVTKKGTPHRQSKSRSRQRQEQRRQVREEYRKQAREQRPRRQKKDERDNRPRARRQYDDQNLLRRKPEKQAQQSPTKKSKEDVKTEKAPKRQRNLSAESNQHQQKGEYKRKRVGSPSSSSSSALSSESDSSSKSK